MSTQKPRPLPTAINPLPVELLVQLCDLMSSRKETPSLLAIMRTSAQLYEIASPFIYGAVSLNAHNIKAFFYGLERTATNGLRFPSSSSQEYRPAYTVVHTGPHGPSQTPPRHKAKQLELVKHVILDQSLSEAHCPPHYVSGGRGMRQRIRGVTMLDWFLSRSTTSKVRHLPSVRKVTYYELPRIDPGPSLFLARVVHANPPIYSSSDMLVLTIRIQPNTFLQTGNLPSLHPIVTNTKRYWDICIRSEVPSEDLSLYLPSHGRLSINNWLQSFGNNQLAAIHDLSIHSHDQGYLSRLGGLRSVGRIQLYLPRIIPASTTNGIPDPSHLTVLDDDEDGSQKYFDLILCLLLDDQRVDGVELGARIEVYPSSGDVEYAYLDAAIKVLSLFQDSPVAISEDGPPGRGRVLALDTDGDGDGDEGQEVWLAGRGDMTVCDTCRCGEIQSGDQA